MKQCVRCQEEKPYADFYNHPGMPDGRLNKCKPCARSDAIKNRNEKADYYRDYDKHRAMQPHRIAQRLQYQQTERGRAALAKSKAAWVERNPIKRKANIAVGNAVRCGVIEKPGCCESCGKSNTRIHGHHCDYSKPLDVVWLCPACHTEWHKTNGEGANAGIVTPVEIPVDYTEI